MKDVLWGAAALVLVSATHAELRNHFSPAPLAVLRPYAAPLPTGVHELDAGTARGLLGRDFALFVDTGAGLPGALKLTMDHFQPSSSALQKMRQAATVTVVVGPEALPVADGLKRLGATDVRVVLRW